jgi:hypothetical protein
MQAGSYLQPEQVVWTGDLLDLPEQSRWEKRPEFAGTTNRALDRATEMFSQMAANAPLAQQVVIEGNHDQRLKKLLALYALAVYGVRRARLPHESEYAEPALSMRYLLRLDEIGNGVKFVDGYPAEEHWINDWTRAVHGTYSAPGRTATSSKHISAHPNVNTFFGHDHDKSETWFTTHDANGAQDRFAIGVGALCRIDGEVPSMGGGVHDDGTSVKRIEDWRQGFAVYYWNEETGEDFVQNVTIRDGKLFIASNLEAWAEAVAA